MSNAIPLIDCDIHPEATKDNPLDPFVPEEAREMMRQGLSGSPGTGYSNPFGVTRRDAECKDPNKIGVDHLDKYGIRYGILQPPGMKASLTNQPDAANAIARAWNDWQINTWLAADKRILGSVCINVNDPQAAVKEIRRAGAHPQMVQVNVSGESRDLYGHRRYFPIYEAMSEMNLPLCLHPGQEGSMNSATPVGRPSTYFEWHTIIPLTFQAHLVSLVLEGVFEKFPKMKLVLCEGGVAWLPHTIWRMDKNFKALRSTTPWLRRAPSEYVFDHVRLTTQPLEEPQVPEQLLSIFEIIKAERTLMFATDFPHWDFDEPTRTLPRAIDPAMKRRIFYDNAAELYGLPKADAQQPASNTAASAAAAGAAAAAAAIARMQGANV
ncbi:MAG TPA: amidohydrolase family protein [Tepidisphaeraceae bacterium]|jgi:predicted TIM-barrel fold metal-dependent hydrolase|nr:amidohydrolase family protein [Tepidisphaeraceae bacterium]